MYYRTNKARKNISESVAMPVTLKDSYLAATVLIVKTVRSVNSHPAAQLPT
jgi:hypothetical protein